LTHPPQNENSTAIHGEIMPRHLPVFANETEEANWWYDNREKHADEFIQAEKEGRVTRGGGIVRRLEEAEKAKTVTLLLEDALKATALAKKKDMDVQAYLTDLIHKAIQQEVESAAA